MKNISFILLVATIIRLVISIIISPNQNTIDNDNNNILTQTLGPGILPAIGAAILDPIHTWDHLQEACFWLENSPSLWTDALSFDTSSSSDGASIVNYSAIYTPGTRIVAPPLVVAFLGETLVCRPNKLSISLQFIIRTLLLLVADGIGAYCIYKLGWHILETENNSNEAEMERHTLLSDKMKKLGGSSPSDLVIPDVLRPERGWVVDLPTKSENGLGGDKVQTNDETAAFDLQRELNRLSMVTEEPIKPVGRGDSYYNEVENDALKRHHSQQTTKSTPTTIVHKEPIIRLDQLPLIAAVLYFCNPIAMLANATGSIRSLYDAILLISFYYATLQPIKITKEGIPMKVPSVTKVSICLALVTYADTGYCMFLLPIILWRGLFKDASAPVSIQRAQHHDWKMVLCLYFLYLGGLHFLASLLVGGGDWREYRAVMVQTILPNIAFVQQDDSGSVPGPCLGVHWYMFVQMFDRFRPYFTVFVAGIPAMFAIPLMTRLHRYPSVLAATFQLLWVIYRPTSTAHTLTFGMILALLNPRTIVRMRNPSIIAFFALPVPILLFVTFHRMWLVTGNGNPNYIFFQCFAYGMFVIIISMDFVSASVKRDKIRRMIEKGSIKKILAELKEKETEGELKTEKDDEEGNTTNGVQKEATGTEEDESAGADEKATGLFADVADQKVEPNVVFL